MSTIVKLGTSPNGAIEGLVRQKLREQNPNVTQAEVTAATNQVLADSGYTPAEATSLGTDANVDISSIASGAPATSETPAATSEIPAATQAPAPVSGSNPTSTTEREMPSFTLTPVRQADGTTAMTPVPVKNETVGAVNGNNSLGVGDQQAAAATPNRQTKFPLGENSSIEQLVRRKLSETNPNVTQAEVSAAVQKVMADPANAAVLSDGPTRMMPTDQVELASILPPPPEPAPAPIPAPTPPPAAPVAQTPPVAQTAPVTGNQQQSFVLVPNPFFTQSQPQAGNQLITSPTFRSPAAAATPGTANGNNAFSALGTLLEQTLKNEQDSRRRSRGIPGVTGSPILSQPFGSNAGLRLDDIGALPSPGSFNSALGTGSLFNNVVRGIGGGNILAKRGLFF